jgi:hypothetical protein
VNLPLLAAETLEKDIWYPTILGILVVVFAVLLFCGSIYLLLATNMGARLGFLVAFTCLMGFMVVLTSLWITTASPLNTLKGRDPHWEAIEVVNDPTKAKTEEIRDVEAEGRKLTTADAADVKAASDETLVTVQAVPGEAEIAQQAFARFQAVTDYLVVNTYEIGGSNPSPLDFELTHEQLFAVVEFCEVKEVEVPFGTGARVRVGRHQLPRAEPRPRLHTSATRRGVRGIGPPLRARAARPALAGEGPARREEGRGRRSRQGRDRRHPRRPREGVRQTMTNLRRTLLVAALAALSVVGLAPAAGAQQIVDASGEGGGGGLAFVLMALMVMLIWAALFFMDRIRRRREEQAQQ